MLVGARHDEPVEARAPQARGAGGRAARRAAEPRNPRGRDRRDSRPPSAPRSASSASARAGVTGSATSMCQLVPISCRGAEHTGDQRFDALRDHRPTAPRAAAAQLAPVRGRSIDSSSPAPHPAPRAAIRNLGIAELQQRCWRMLRRNTKFWCSAAKRCTGVCMMSFLNLFISAGKAISAWRRRRTRLCRTDGARRPLAGRYRHSPLGDPSGCWQPIGRRPGRRCPRRRRSRRLSAGGRRPDRRFAASQSQT